jgi:site-specific recombinase XerD
MRTLIITHSPRGRLLKKPLVLQVKDEETLAERKLRQYITDTFLCRQVKLAEFVYKHESIMQVARHYLFHISGSQKSLYQTAYCVERYFHWLHLDPDKYVKQCLDKNGRTKPKAIAEVRRQIGDFISYLNDRDLSRSQVKSYVRSINRLLSLNGVRLDLPYTIRVYPTYSYRAPTLEELQKLIDVATLRERVAISMLAVGGIRVGSLARLQYHHLKDDLERNIVPVCVHIEALITKGRYHSYYTFLNEEAAEYLKAYLNLRRMGTKKLPAEQIHDNSPIIRLTRTRKVEPPCEYTIQGMVHDAYCRAGLLDRNKGLRRNELTSHSLRKFFQTEMAARGVNPDYIHFMMGHVTNRYADIKMKGIDYLRGIYLTAGLRMRPKVKLTRIDALKEIISSWGLNPEEILSRKVLAQEEQRAPRSTAA